MGVNRFLFGYLDDEAVPGFVLSNRAGMRAKVMAFGARLTEMHIPDRNGRLEDVVLGYDNLGDYVMTSTFCGATCGRFGNRIARGEFSLDGQRHRLALNDGPNHLHGGPGGFDHRIWAAAADEASNSVVFSLASPDGDEGYPGSLAAVARYRLTEAGELEITMSAATDVPTIVAMVHHSYWNLAGHGSGDVRAQTLQINADFYTPLDSTLIPTGTIAPVAGTPYDFTRDKPIGVGLDAVGGVGFDDNYCLRGPTDTVRPVVRMIDPASGRGLEMSTDQPGMQLYSAGAFPAEGIVGKGGTRYPPHAGVALEAQKFPNSPNVGHFPSARLGLGEFYQNHVRFRFFSQ
jgi:aldose 1-epimerase